MKTLYTITIKTNGLNKCHFQNANRFVRCIVVNSKEALDSKIAEFKANGIVIKSVYDYCGKKIAF